MPRHQHQRLPITTLGAALLAGLGMVAVAQPQERQITWAALDWPPVMILREQATPASPEQLGSGIADRKLLEVTTRLPQYRHSFQLFNGQRVWEAMREGQNICYSMAFKTPEREELAYFTPIMLVPPIAVVVRANMKQRITQGASTVSLAALMRKSEFAGRIEATRSYGPEVDWLLSRAQDSPKVESVPRTGFLANMLAVGRYDYTLEYPLVVEYMRQQQSLPYPLEVVAIKEAQQWVTGYVACTRNAWGKGVIRDIDAAIRAAAATSRPYREALLPWLPALYWQQNRLRINAFYDERAKAAPALP